MSNSPSTISGARRNKDMVLSMDKPFCIAIKATSPRRTILDSLYKHYKGKMPICATALLPMRERSVRYIVDIRRW
jgi:hypothetical protein